MSDELLTALKWPAAILLIALSALFAGLTLGMLSLDKIELEVVAAGEDKKLAECARKIIPVRENANLLLCTFLVGNTACNSLSSILMADLEGGTMGFVISTVAILFFAEIIPQALCSRYALQIGARVIIVVKFFIVLFYPIAKPISMILDCTLGEDVGTIHTRQELSKLLQIHVSEGAIDHESGNILQGALRTMNHMKVTDILTPIEDCYMLHISRTLDFKTVSEIFEFGYSRVPVYDKNKSDVVAILFTKDLILVDPDDQTSLRYFISIFGRPVQSFPDTATVKEAFVKLKQGHGHLAVVKNDEEHIIGVITLEDIVEEIIQGEIMDETDLHVEHIHKKGSKFRMFNTHAGESVLSPEEVKALASHLLMNIPAFRDSHVDKDCLRWILHQSEVVTISDASKKIYEKGTPAEFCLIVLTGRLEIRSGENEYRKDAGSLSVVAPEALFDESYVPDFTATVTSERCRMVVIKRSLLQAACRVYSTEDAPINPGVGADPKVRNAFAYQLFTRKSRKDGFTPASRLARDPRVNASEPPHGNAHSDPGDDKDRESLSDLHISYSTSDLPRPDGV
jgi:metal transporter CNNM